MDAKLNDRDMILGRLRQAICLEKESLLSYEKPCEPIAYEVLRAFDDLFCRELMFPDESIAETDRLSRSLSTWGVNHALRRIVPKVYVDAPFKDFPSRVTMQASADDFLFRCGVLAISERLKSWLQEGLLRGEIRRHSGKANIDEVIVLQRAVNSYFDEDIGRRGLEWSGRVIWKEDRSRESKLEERHKLLEPELRSRVRLDGWRVVYASTPEIDDYFLEWARLYLRRIFSQDMIGPDDEIGGRPFSRYIEVLEALSARNQKHVAYAAILAGRHPSLHMRNLVTTYAPKKLLIRSLSDRMGGIF